MSTSPLFSLLSASMGERERRMRKTATPLNPCPMPVIPIRFGIQLFSTVFQKSLQSHNGCTCYISLNPCPMTGIPISLFSTVFFFFTCVWGRTKVTMAALVWFFKEERQRLRSIFAQCPASPSPCPISLKFPLLLAHLLHPSWHLSPHAHCPHWQEAAQINILVLLVLWGFCNCHRLVFSFVCR